MFRAASERFVNSPWQHNPRRTVFDVRGGAEVYSWVQQVFLNQLYMELPADGAPEGAMAKGISAASGGVIVLNMRTMVTMHRLWTSLCKCRGNIKFLFLVKTCCLEILTRSRTARLLHQHPSLPTG